MKKLTMTNDTYNKSTAGSSGHGLGKPELHLATTCLRYVASLKNPLVAEQQKVVANYLRSLETMEPDANCASR